MILPLTVAGTVHLLRFAHLKTKKTFAFTSSVSTNMGKSAIGKTISESPIENDPSLALETGYAQSKFIGTVPFITLHPNPLTSDSRGDCTDLR